MQTPYFRRMSSLSIWALGMTGIFLRRASMTSGLVSGTALETTTPSASPTFEPYGLKDHGPKLFKPRRDVALLLVRAADGIARIEQDLGDAGHARAADADEMELHDFFKHSGILS